MAAKIGHPCFESPPDPSIKIWRYINFTEYVAFLQTQSLYFARSDRFEDPYEGATSYANIVLRPIIYKGKNLPETAFKKISQFAEWIREWTFINCWHMNEHESSAMWKLYTHTEEVLTIQSTFEKLQRCLPASCFLGIVKYIDYEKDWMPEDNLLWRFVHKRKSFEHEKEVRAVIQEYPTKELPNNEKEIQVGLSNNERGRLVKVECEALVEQIFISPTASEWFGQLEVNPYPWTDRLK
ncbi:MAG: DUF2971 domain-containing protein [Candidatus Ratteibacteria bacterium]|jgi:hypothetical protein